MAVLKYKKKDGTYATLTNIAIKGVDPKQTTGDSVTDVMSQAAITTELANKLATSDFNTYSGEVSTSLGEKALTSDLTAHTSNSTIHVTSDDKTKWDDVTNKVDKVTGKGLSTNDYTTDEKDKLSGIASGAEVNVQSDWDEDDSTSDAFILNKPALGTSASKGVSNGITNSDNLIESKHIYSGVGVTIAYDSSTNYIQLKSTSGQVLSSFDASSFLVDGMVDSVTLDAKSGTTYLVVTWNTAAGKTTTELNIGDIFEADNYYTKSEIDAYSGSVNNSFTAHTASSVHMSDTEKRNLDSLATNIASISGITSTKVSNWDTAYESAHTHTNKDTLDAITASSTAINSLTGTVGTMAFQNTSSYSSATQVNTALNGKSNTDHKHVASDVTAFTNYEVASSSASVSTNDTLLQVIGKLEKRIQLLESAMGGISIVKITQTDYDNLLTKDSNTLYVII